MRGHKSFSLICTASRPHATAKAEPIPLNPRTLQLIPYPFLRVHLSGCPLCPQPDDRVWDFDRCEDLAAALDLLADELGAPAWRVESFFAAFCMPSDAFALRFRRCFGVCGVGFQHEEALRAVIMVPCVRQRTGFRLPPFRQSLCVSCPLRAVRPQVGVARVRRGGGQRHGQPAGAAAAAAAAAGGEAHAR